jgi:hypothetical protein
VPHQEALTIWARVVAGRAELLERLLRDRCAVLPFAEVPGRTSAAC